MISIETFLLKSAPVIVTVFFCALVLWVVNWLLFRKGEEHEHEHKFPRQMLMLILMLASVIALVISLPISEGTQTQILSLIGLIISGLLAFSSTTMFSNVVAGTMMRFTRPFVTGDFIRINEYAGRVTERGLFDCEIQTENRELIAIPNNYLINHPVSVVRSSGAIVAVSLSLGYDVHHSEVESLLVQAASEIGLDAPFVHVTELGDFSITYKISGLLLEVKNLITTRSRLYCQVLDVLHNNGIEIMSPSFMNQRKLDDNYQAIPKSKQAPQAEQQKVAEDIIFDKAEEAQQNEEQKGELVTKLSKVKEQLASSKGKQKDELKQKVSTLKEEISVKVEAAKAAKED